MSHLKISRKQLLVPIPSLYTDPTAYVEVGVTGPVAAVCDQDLTVASHMPQIARP